MPAHTNTHRTRTLLPLILTITLLLTAAAIIELPIGAAGVLLLARARHARHP